MKMRKKGKEIGNVSDILEINQTEREYRESERGR